MHEFDIIAFRALDNPKLSEEFLDGHVKVLIDYGVTMITSNKATWPEDPNVYCVVALSKSDGKMEGGVRVHISDQVNPLPLEDAIGKIDSKIYDIVKGSYDVGVGEICGLWNSKKVAGIGLSHVLTRAGISITNQLNFQSLMTICADFTLNMCIELGFDIDDTLGDGGKFPYPTEEYTTRVLGILNSKTLSTATEFDKERILLLRKSPILTINEGKKTEFIVNYKLLLEKS